MCRRFTLERVALVALLAESACLLGLVRVAVAVLPFPVIARGCRLRAGESAGSPQASTPALPTEAVQAERVAWAVEAAAVRLPWHTTCLMRALTASVMLRRRHVASTLYLGVAHASTSPDGVAAHAWLRVGTAVLTGSSGHEQFGIVGRFTTARTI